MSDHRDIVDIDGFRNEGCGKDEGPDGTRREPTGRRFLSGVLHHLPALMGIVAPINNS